MEKEFIEGLQLIIGIIFIFITVIGLAGNAVVLFVIALNKQLHDRWVAVYFKYKCRIMIL